MKAAVLGSGVEGMAARFSVTLAAALGAICWAQLAGAADTAARTTNDCRSVAEGATDNAAMRVIFEADQADRRENGDTDWEAVNRRDLERLSQTEALIAGNALVTGSDFFRAAFIFQHGSEPRSYLKAHSLSLVAIACGRRDATWIATAALDRYLQAIGQPQVFGTQFRFPDAAPVTQEPYDRSLIADSLRQRLGVPPLVDQEQQRQRIQAKAEQGQ